MIIYLFIIVILFILLYLLLNNEKSKYKVISFKGKKNYLCCMFLYGNCGLKTNKAVLSRKNNTFLIETEDNTNTISSYEFNIDDIVNVDISENLSFKSGEQQWNNFTTPDTFGRHSTYSTVKTTKYSKIYDIKISLKNNVNMHLQSNKNPYNIFDSI